MLPEFTGLLIPIPVEFGLFVFVFLILFMYTYDKAWDRSSGCTFDFLKASFFLCGL